MSAEKKPEQPAEVPPFLQTKPGQTKPSTPKPAPAAEASPEIPFFLRAGSPGVPPEKEVTRAKPPPGAQTTKPDPGLLFSLGGSSRMPSPAETAPAPPPAPASPPPAPTSPPEDKPAPAFLRSEAQLPETDVHMPSPVLSAEEVQRRLEEMTRANDKKEQASASAVPSVAGNEVPVVRKAVYSKPIDWESAPAIFEQMVEGIRRDRVTHEKEMMDQSTKVEADWQHVLDSMRQLQQKVQGHPNLIYFTISRDQQDISIKVVDYSNKRGYSLFTLSRRHPAGAHPSLNAVWLIEFPAREWHYYDAKEAMGELVARIAGALA